MPNNTRTGLGRLAVLGLLILAYFVLFPEDLSPLVVVANAITPGLGIIIGAGIVAGAIGGIWMGKAQALTAPAVVEPRRPVEVVSAEVVTRPKAPEPPGKPLEVLPAGDSGAEVLP